MYTVRFYVIAAIDIQSDKPITEDMIIDKISSEMKHEVKYQNNNTVIVGTEIQDVSTVPFF